MSQPHSPKPHSFGIRVYYEDTDFSGLVYHASYLRFMERARTELLRGLDVTQRVLRDEGEIFFVVRSMNIDFRRPALMDDMLRVETKVTEIGAVSFQLEQQVLREQELLVSAAVVIVPVKNGRARPLPLELREAFERILHG